MAAVDRFDHDETSPEAWKADAACRGMNVATFFPDMGWKTSGQTSAKTVCAECPVRQPCADYSMAPYEKYGIWGGANEADRRRVRRYRVVTHLRP